MLRQQLRDLKDASGPGRRSFWPTLLLLVIYGVVLFRLTLLSREGTSGSITSNLVPFRTIQGYLDSGLNNSVAMRNVFGNLALLTPIAFYFAIISPRLKPVYCLVFMGAVSLLIELIQSSGLVDGRGFDIDDLILNVLGSAATFFAARQIRKTIVKHQE